MYDRASFLPQFHALKLGMVLTDRASDPQPGSPYGFVKCDHGIIPNRLNPPSPPSATRLLFDESSRCLLILESTCQQILNHMGPQSNAVNLARVISRDHGLTCKVLQVANSIAYSPQRRLYRSPMLSVGSGSTPFGLSLLRHILLNSCNIGRFAYRSSEP